jgi:hypothetical protein
MILPRATTLEARRTTTGVDGPSTEADQPRRTGITSPAEALDGLCHPSSSSHTASKAGDAPWPRGLCTRLPEGRFVHTSRGRAQRHLPWGSLPLDEVSTEDRCVPAYLPGTIRSRSFSLPQRFHPLDTSWLCFTPHPSKASGLQSFFRATSRDASRRPLLSCRFPAWPLARPESFEHLRVDFRALLQSRSRHPT